MVGELFLCILFCKAAIVQIFFVTHFFYKVG